MHSRGFIQKQSNLDAIRAIVKERQAWNTLLRDEGNVVRPNTAVIKVDFRPEEKLENLSATDASEMTVRIGGLVAKSVTDMTQRVPDMEGLGLVADENAPEQLRLSWPGGTTTIRDGLIASDETKPRAMAATAERPTPVRLHPVAIQWRPKGN